MGKLVQFKDEFLFVYADDPDLISSLEELLTYLTIRFPLYLGKNNKVTDYETHGSKRLINVTSEELEALVHNGIRISQAAEIDGLTVVEIESESQECPSFERLQTDSLVAHSNKTSFNQEIEADFPINGGESKLGYRLKLVNSNFQEIVDCYGKGRTIVSIRNGIVVVGKQSNEIVVKSDNYDETLFLRKSQFDTPNKTSLTDYINSRLEKAREEIAERIENIEDEVAGASMQVKALRDHLARQSRDLEDFLRFGKKTSETDNSDAEELVKAARSFKEIKEISFEEECLILTTFPLKCRVFTGNDIERYIRIPSLNVNIGKEGEIRLSCVDDEDYVESNDGEWCHPHCPSHGRPCMGNYENSIPDAFRRGDWSTYFGLIVEYLTSANTIDAWGKRALEENWLDWKEEGEVIEDDDDQTA